MGYDNKQPHHRHWPQWKRLQTTKKQQKTYDYNRSLRQPHNMIWSENADFIALSHLGTGYYLYCFKNSICLYLCEQLVFKDVKDFICIERSLLITAVGTPPNGKNDYSFTRWFSGRNPTHGEETLIMPTPFVFSIKVHLGPTITNIKETRPSRPIGATCGSSNKCVTNRPTDWPTNRHSQL